MGLYGAGTYGAGLYGSSGSGGSALVPGTVALPDLYVAPAEYQILITDRNLNVLGDPITDWLTIDVTLRFNEPGGGFFEAPAYPWIEEQLVPGCRIVVIRAGQILISGPLEEGQVEESDDGEHAGVGKLRVTFADDLLQVVAREVYPDPTLTPPAQTINRWTFTGNAEAGLRALVEGNAGPTAGRVERRVPQLVLGATAGVGTAIAVSATRMQHLGDLARKMAEIGGNIGFRVRQVGGQLQFQVFAPPNKSGTVRFGFGLGNLKYRARFWAAPKVTTAIVGGQGDGADAYMIERTNTADEAAWGRYERLVPRPGSTTVTELEDEGDRELANNAATTRVAANTADTPDCRYGVHYDVGDIVSIETGPATEQTGIVYTVHIQVYAQAGEVVAATVGSQAASPDPRWVQLLKELDERLNRLERTVTPA